MSVRFRREGRKWCGIRADYLTRAKNKHSKQADKVSAKKEI